nr:apoptosis-associated speck-like protein containing a CARD isoform X3 [Doryrhamphus excisus]
MCSGIAVSTLSKKEGAELLSVAIVETLSAVVGQFSERRNRRRPSQLRHNRYPDAAFYLRQAQYGDEELSKHSSKAPSDRRESLGSSSRSNVCHQGDDEEHFVDRHKTELIKRLSNINPILDFLLEKNVIQDEVYDDIRAVKGNQQKMREIYRQALKSGNKAKDLFLKALEENDPYLVDDLREYRK